MESFKTCYQYLIIQLLLNCNFRNKTVIMSMLFSLGLLYSTELWCRVYINRCVLTWSKAIVLLRTVTFSMKAMLYRQWLVSVLSHSRVFIQPGQLPSLLKFQEWPHHVTEGRCVLITCLARGMWVIEASQSV